MSDKLIRNEQKAIKDLYYLIDEFSAYPKETGVCETIGTLIYSIKALEDVQEYRKLGTVEEVREAVEKTKEKKLVEWANGTLHCPNCDKDNSCLGFNVCIECGQKLDWSDEE